MSPAIRLEPLTPADGPYFYELGSDPQVARYMRFSPLTDPAQGDELPQSYTTGGNLAWRIVDAVSGRSAGVAALKLGDHEDTRRSVSLFLARDAWGQGYGAAAVRALQAQAVELGFSTLAGFIVEENTASRRLAEKCGFTLEEILHFPHIKPGLCLYGWRA